jgi:hypothetical protein
MAEVVGLPWMKFAIETLENQDPSKVKDLDNEQLLKW